MKTSVYIPDAMAEVAREQGLSLSQVVQLSLREAITWALTPGPRHHYEVTGAKLADIITLMTEAGIPLTATLHVRHDHGRDRPGVFIEWTDPPAQELNGEAHGNAPGESHHDPG